MGSLASHQLRYSPEGPQPKTETLSSTHQINPVWGSTLFQVLYLLRPYPGVVFYILLSLYFFGVAKFRKISPYGDFQTRQQNDGTNTTHNSHLQNMSILSSCVCLSLCVGMCAQVAWGGECMCTLRCTCLSVQVEAR